MRNKVPFGLKLLMVLLFGWFTDVWADSIFHLIDRAQIENIPSLLWEEALTPQADHSIPRNQVLLEMTTGTW
jgi:hypothetical protein